MKYLTYLILISFLFACNSLSPKTTQYSKAAIEAQEMRHGWAFFSAPKSTLIFETNTNSMQRGQKLYSIHCLSCHGQTGKGNGISAKSLITKPANLTTYSKARSKHYVFFQLHDDTKSEMPKWKDILTTDQTSDLSHYVHSLRK
jgi:mono/diheme cytochrome c family protein